MDHVGSRPAAWPGAVCAFKPQQDFAAGIQEIIARGAATGLHDFVRNASLLQDAHAFVVDMGGTRKRIDACLFLSDDDLNPALRKQYRQRHTGWSAAGDKDIAIKRHASAFRDHGRLDMPEPVDFAAHNIAGLEELARVHRCTDPARCTGEHDVARLERHAE